MFVCVSVCFCLKNFPRFVNSTPCRVPTFLPLPTPLRYTPPSSHSPFLYRTLGVELSVPTLSQYISYQNRKFTFAPLSLLIILLWCLLAILKHLRDNLRNLQHTLEKMYILLFYLSHFLCLSLIPLLIATALSLLFPFLQSPPPFSHCLNNCVSSGVCVCVFRGSPRFS